MPELPEVETIRRAARAASLGETIHACRDLRSDALTRPRRAEALAARSTARAIVALDRRGKYLLFRFESGARLLIHLRMTGSLRHRRSGADLLPYERARIELDDGSELVYRDVRRFGTWRLLEAGELEELFRRSRRPGTAGAGVHPGASTRALGRAPDRAQGGPARSAHAGRAREHLRRRGALGGAPASRYSRPDR